MFFTDFTILQYWSVLKYFIWKWNNSCCFKICKNNRNLTIALGEKWRMAFFDFGWLKNVFKNFSNNVSDGYAFNLALGMFISTICAADFLI